MLNRPAFKATPTASPVSIKGVAATIMLATPLRLPNDPSSRLRYAIKGSSRFIFFSGPISPEAIMRTDATSRASRMDNAGTTNRPTYDLGRDIMMFLLCQMYPGLLPPGRTCHLVDPRHGLGPRSPSIARSPPCWPLAFLPQAPRSRRDTSPRSGRRAQGSHPVRRRQAEFLYSHPACELP